MTESSQVDLVGVGLNATDTLIFLSTYPECGSKVNVRDVHVSPGGQVATALIACQQWGLRTRYVGKLGDDAAAGLHRKEFECAGVETHIATIADCPSARSFILVDQQAERTVLWGRDQRLELRPDDLRREWIVSARALLVDGCDTSAATVAAKWATEARIPVIADLDETYPGIEELLEFVDYCVVSRNFPERLTGEPDLRESLPLIHSRFGCKLAAATLGTGGVLAWDGNRFYSACAYRVMAVDTTGAGDIFHAGFIYGLLCNWPVQRQLDFACAAAGLNCTAAGARGGIASLSEIENLMANGEQYPEVP